MQLLVSLFLSQFGGFGVGLLQDGDGGVGIFPKREEIVIGGQRFGLGGSGLRGRSGSGFQRQSPR